MSTLQHIKSPKFQYGKASSNSDNNCLINYSKEIPLLPWWGLLLSSSLLAAIPSIQESRLPSVQSRGLQIWCNVSLHSFRGSIAPSKSVVQVSWHSLLAPGFRFPANPWKFVEIKKDLANSMKMHQIGRKFTQKLGFKLFPIIIRTTSHLHLRSWHKLPHPP